MDCVGCEKCRLWGKLQVTGIGTALKIMFSYDKIHLEEMYFELRPMEIIALLNTLGRFSNSLQIVKYFLNSSAVLDKESGPESTVESMEGGTRTEVRVMAVGAAAFILGTAILFRLRRYRKSRPASSVRDQSPRKSQRKRQ